MPSRSHDDPKVPVRGHMDARRNTRRQLLLTLPAVLVTGLLAVLLAMSTAGARGEAIATPHAAHTAAEHAVSPAELRLREGMRALWEEHITWTRMAIVDFAAGSPGLDATTARLLRNQTDIGNAIGPFYGRAAGRRLTALLRSHILIAVDVLVAAKAGDEVRLGDAQARWTANGNQIADFLWHANPHAWPRAEMRQMMRRHLTLTTAEAVARLHGDWLADVRAYDRVHTQALAMADMLSTGIVRQFPRRFP